MKETIITLIAVALLAACGTTKQMQSNRQPDVYVAGYELNEQNVLFAKL
jgi:uncharacterized lipoprotein YajG